MILKALTSIHICVGERQECHNFFNKHRPSCGATYSVGKISFFTKFSPQLIQCKSIATDVNDSTTSQSTDRIEAFLDLVRIGNIESFLLEIRNGYDVNSTDSESWNSLHWATEMGNQTLVIRLLDIDPLLLNSKTREGLSAINIAAWRGDKSMVELLISQGAEIDDKTKWGETPLHHAVTFGHTEVCQALLAYGADPHAEDRLKRTPYQIAMKRGSEKMKKILRRYGDRTH